MLKRTVVFILAAMLIIGCMCACKGKQEATTENPRITHWGHNFYDNLLKYENGEIKGALAESWEVSQDGKKYTFHLRKGVKFSDGSDFTANAVKVSFEQAIKNLGMYNGSYGRLSSLIASMDTSDDNTFVMELSQPYYGVLNDLTMCTPLAIVNPKAFEQDPFEACKTATMGTGPYMYDSNDGEKIYRFVRNPYYWGDKPEAGWTDEDKDGIREKNGKKLEFTMPYQCIWKQG